MPETALQANTSSKRVKEGQKGKRDEELELGVQTKAVKGTDSDLRRLNMNEMTQMLLMLGAVEEEIRKPRWERFVLASCLALAPFFLLQLGL